MQSAGDVRLRQHSQEGKRGHRESYAETRAPSGRRGLGAAGAAWKATLHVFAANMDTSSRGVGDLSPQVDGRWDIVVRRSPLEPYYWVQMPSIRCVMGVR